MSADRRERLWWAFGGVLVVAYALVPVAWLVSLSLKPAEDLGDNRFLPRQVTFEHYASIFQDTQFASALWNSAGIAAISTLAALLLGAGAAYAIVRLQFSGRRLLLAAALAVTGAVILSTYPVII